jgi:hypothetical protein
MFRAWHALCCPVPLSFPSLLLILQVYIQDGAPPLCNGLLLLQPNSSFSFRHYRLAAVTLHCKLLLFRDIRSGSALQSMHTVQCRCIDPISLLWPDITMEHFYNWQPGTIRVLVLTVFFQYCGLNPGPHCPTLQPLLMLFLRQDLCRPCAILLPPPPRLLWWQASTIHPALIS